MYFTYFKVEHQPTCNKLDRFFEKQKKKELKIISQLR
jgi:hypothetical protein